MLRLSDYFFSLGDGFAPNVGYGYKSEIRIPAVTAVFGVVAQYKDIAFWYNAAAPITVIARQGYVLSGDEGDSLHTDFIVIGQKNNITHFGFATEPGCQQKGAWGVSGFHAGPAGHEKTKVQKEYHGNQDQNSYNGQRHTTLQGNRRRNTSFKSSVMSLPDK